MGIPWLTIRLCASFAIGSCLLEGSLRGDVITDWNIVLVEAVHRDVQFATPTYSSRNMAMVHLAMAEAFNAVRPTWSSWLHPPLPPDRSADLQAACSRAAWTVLVGLYPTQRPYFDAQLEAALAAVPAGYARSAGLALGDTAGTAVLGNRTGDGAAGVNNYVPVNAVGHWQPTYPYYLNAVTPWWGGVRTFGIKSLASVQAPPPPALDSLEYTTAFNQISDLGALQSLTRSADQDQIGTFWAYDRVGMGPPTVAFNEMLRQIAEQRGNSVEANARLFALVNMAMADGAIACWADKYIYDFWRPITAMRQAGTDANRLTMANPTWEPRGCPGAGIFQDFTPPFPSYPSGHSTFGGAVFEVLRQFYGTDTAEFSLMSNELPGVMRHYHSFSQAAEENGWSRVYLGVHWGFDVTAGLAQGREIGAEIHASQLRLLSNAALGWAAYQ